MPRRIYFIVWNATALFAAPLLAVPLAPGGFVNLLGTSFDERPELGGVVLEDVVRPFSADSGGGNFTTGTIQDRVVESVSGTLDFYYFINVDVSSAGAVDFVTRTNLTGFSTDVDWRSDGGGPTNPDQASRNAGNQVLFDFFASNLLGPGQQSSFFFIKTAATSYNELGAGALAITSPIGGATFNFNTFQPVPAGATWNVNANGSWTVGTNWNPTTPPNAVGATANFGTINTAPRTVTLNAAQTIGTANFSSAFAYTIAGSNTLTFDGGSPAGINVTAGGHVISAPIVLNSDLTVNTGSNSGVALTGNLTATGRNVSKAGAGTAQFENIRGLTLNVNGGVARISQKGTANSSPGTSKVTSLAISAGAKLDLTNNSAIIDYIGAVGTLVHDTREHLANNRLISSSATTTLGLGYGDNGLLVNSSFAGQAVDASSLLIKFTYLGDTDLDGDVDIADLGNLASNWQTTSVWTGGDFDYNGSINVGDLGLLASNWQKGSITPLGPDFATAAAAAGLPASAVPEPATMTVLGALAAWSLNRSGRRWRRDC